jgi:GNAT superfamily N-acetyltransferase
MGANDTSIEGAGADFVLPGGVRVTSTDDPASPVLDRFFEGYDRAFILPDEREDLEGFRACLALNRTHRHVFGRTHSEQVAVLEDEAGRRLGGVNFLATAIGNGANAQAAVALNYVYVEEAARGRGVLRQCLTAVRMLARTALGLSSAGPSPALFVELNDPLRLTPEAYAQDTEHAGVDQVDRLAIWARMGARIIDFPYVQPALSEDQQPDESLIYATIDVPGAAIDPGLLHDHLESFFGISVLKGRVESPDGAGGRQLAALDDRADPVPLLEMAPALEWLRTGRPTDDFDSFRDLARRAGG